MCCRHNAGYRDLLENERQREGGKEFPTQCNAEYQQRNHEHNQWHSRWIVMQKVPEAIEHRMIAIIKRCDITGTSRQRALILLD